MRGLSGTLGAVLGSATVWAGGGPPPDPSQLLAHEFVQSAVSVGASHGDLAKELLLSIGEAIGFWKCIAILLAFLVLTVGGGAWAIVSKLSSRKSA